MGKNHGKRSKPRGCKKYDRFRILERALILPLISKIVDALPPPYKVKEKGSVGRPSANPRAIVKFLLFKALNGLSYFSAFSELQGSLEDREALGIYSICKKYCAVPRYRHFSGIPSGAYRHDRADDHEHTGEGLLKT